MEREQLGSPPAQPLRDAVTVQGRGAQEDLAALHDAPDDAAQEHDDNAQLHKDLQPSSTAQLTTGLMAGVLAGAVDHAVLSRKASLHCLLLSAAISYSKTRASYQA